MLSALLRCRLEPRSRAAVAKAALELQRTRSNEFAKEKAPTSINPQLDRNQKPGKTKLSWMRGAYKCNFFVGEALSKSGYVMPLSDKHRYAGAGSLHSHRRYFQRIVSPADLRPGDVVTLRWPGKGNAHAAIVTKTGKRKGTIEITGTGRGSVVTEKVSAHLGKDWHEALSTAKYDSKHQRFVLKAADGTRFHVYLLRPKRKR
ncbi:MAG: hypothetical protein CSB49_05345 [Proteobacteria bacterium]|nr:MAG: hypothetical protein CSB49_05345 [Pseudomonadota bacterium]